MADGFRLLGEALGGDSELQYQEGLALGAKTQDALAAARARVVQNEAKQAISEKLQNMNVPFDVAEASAMAFQGGGGLGDAIGLLLKNQEHGFRATAGDPNTSITDANAALRGVASGPVDRYQKVGGGADDRFDEAGIQPLGEALGTDSGGIATPIQVLTAFGLIDPATGRVRQGMERQAFDVMRTTGRITDVQGVPNAVDFNPFPAAPVAAPSPAVPAATGSAVAPPATPAGAALSPLTTAQAAGANAAEIERAKVVGKGTGEAQLALPQALARFNNQTAQTDMVIDNIDKAVNEAGVWTAGPIGKTLGFLPGTPAFDFKNRIDTIKANVGFQQLQQMRYESPTGGALGQVAVQELQFLQSALGSLEQAQSPSQLTEMLGQVSQRYKQFKAAALADYEAAQKKAASMPAAAPVAAPVAQPPAGETKTVGGKTYVKVNGQWFEDDGT